jgi:hypothetical protein
MNTQDIISKIQIKALYLGVAVLLVLSLISFMIGNHFFWKRVSEVRMLTGAGSSMEVGLQVIREPRILMMNLLMISIKYAIAVAVVLKFTRQFYFLNSVSFGLVGVFLLTIVLAFWNIKEIIDYPGITCLEVAVAITVCAAAGFAVQLISKRKTDAT